MATIVYFCDETSFHDTHMAVGGLAVNKVAIPYVVGELAKINDGCKITKEVKWENAKRRRMNAHLQYIDLLFRLIEEGRAHFHIRFAPFNDYDHNLSGRLKRMDTVGKMHYQLILHRALRFYGEKHELIIHPDNGDCTARLPQMVAALNADCRSKLKYQASPVQRIECRDSEKEPLLQLLDVTLGGLTAYRNARHKDPITSEVKRDLAVTCFGKMGLPSLEGSCPFTRQKLNVWNVRPLWKKTGGNPRR